MVKQYFKAIWKQFLSISTSERLLLTLFILRPLYLLMPGTVLPAYKNIDENYTYQVATYFIFLALIELNIVYILYRKYKNALTELLCFIGGGHLVDQFTTSAIGPSLSEFIWIIVSIVYIYYVWKKRNY